VENLTRYAVNLRNQGSPIHEAAFAVGG